MAIYAYPKKLDLDSNRVLFNEEFAKLHGINRGDLVLLHFRDGEVGAIAEYTDTLVGKGEVGIPVKIWTKYNFSGTNMIVIENLHQSSSVELIRKKFQGEPLTESEIMRIIDDITHYRLTPIEMTYFAAAGYCPGFNKEEMYYLTKAMVETGDRLDFNYLGDLIVDKHSIGGVPNKAITPVLVPILAEMGFLVPNTFSRAITTPAGTGDIVETVMNVTLDVNEIKKTVEQTNAVLAWGGAIDLAPADDILIQVEKPLGVESYDKFVVSILAKKISMGVKYLLIDIPYGRFGKVSKEEASKVGDLFVELGAKFGVKVEPFLRESLGCDGYGVGPILEMRDVLKILERHSNRPLHIENIVLEMASRIGVLTGKFDDSKEALIEARHILDTKRALQKFWQIAKIQGVKDVATLSDLVPGAYSHVVSWEQSPGEIHAFNRDLIVEIARSLGTPVSKGAGLEFNVFVGDVVEKGRAFVTLYAETPYRLKDTLHKYSLSFKDLVILNNMHN